VRGDVYALAPPIVTEEQTLDDMVGILADATRAVIG
jgi:adenosylmethionine-8-amino-7-oxononanoate aminotransferase